MRKSLICVVIVILLVTLSQSAYSNNLEKSNTRSINYLIGTFQGEIWAEIDGLNKQIGNLSGNYEQRNHSFRFEGLWEITEGEHSNGSLIGSMIGFFNKFFLYGRITSDGSSKKILFIGFVGVNKLEMSFYGKIKSFNRTQLYLKGTYL